MSCTNDCQRPTPAQAHCGACHRTFGGVTGFDRHRLGGECLDPATRGLTEVRGIWRWPLSKSQAARVSRRALTADHPSLVPSDGQGLPTA